MYDYIKKQVTIDEINKALDRETLLNSFVRKIAVEAVKKLPSADAQPVVRCKDCKWFNKIGCAIKIVDESDKPHEDDFCSFAERRTDESD